MMKPETAHIERIRNIMAKLLVGFKTNPTRVARLDAARNNPAGLMALGDENH
jgi:hypothetical protein